MPSADMSCMPCCGVSVCCCSPGITLPTTLTLSFVSNRNFIYPLTTCADYTGLTIPLVYGTYAAFSSAPLNRWQGTGTNAPGTGTLIDHVTCMLWCQAGCSFTGYMYCGTQTFGETLGAVTTTCSPFEIDFIAGGAEPGCGNGCPQQRNWKITT